LLIVVDTKYLNQNQNRELERFRTEQLELASQAEFSLSRESIASFAQSQQALHEQSFAGHSSSHVPETPLKLPPAADCTPMRPEALKSSRRRGAPNNAFQEQKDAKSDGKDDTFDGTCLGLA
jgi:hypothetical protein